MTKTTRICLWSSPRNISTAMMYSFSQRPDTSVFDEPLYAHYLKVTGANHPGREQILASQCCDGEQVVKNIILGETDDETTKIAFFKQMTHHLVDLNEDFLLQTQNILFIRNPEQIITSFAQVIPNVTLADIGLEKQWELFNKLVTSQRKPIVLDSNEILKDPNGVLKKLCSALEIPFYDQMLQWEKGGRKEDGVWAKHWYKNVHSSTGFEKQPTSQRKCPEHFLGLLREAQPFYDQLYVHSIRA